MAPKTRSEASKQNRRTPNRETRPRCWKRLDGRLRARRPEPAAIRIGPPPEPQARRQGHVGGRPPRVVRRNQPASPSGCVWQRETPTLRHGNHRPQPDPGENPGQGTDAKPFRLVRPASWAVPWAQLFAIEAWWSRSQPGSPREPIEAAPWPIGAEAPDAFRGHRTGVFHGSGFPGWSGFPHFERSGFDTPGWPNGWIQTLPPRSEMPSPRQWRNRSTIVGRPIVGFLPPLPGSRPAWSTPVGLPDGRSTDR